MNSRTAHIPKFLALFLLILVGSLWMLLGVNLPGNSRVIYELQNSGHTLLFCLVTFGFAFAIQRYWIKTSAPLAIALAAGLSFVFGGLSELIQPQFGRDSSWGDLYQDVIGIVAGVFVAIAWRSQRIWRFIFVFLCGLTVLYGLISPLTWFYAKEKRDSQFPLLGDFESAAGSRFFEARYNAKLFLVAAPETWLENTSQVARVDFHPGSWPGIEAFDLRGNWAQYQRFQFDVFNPHAFKLNLVIRIHDSTHNNQHDDRFNKTISLTPGLNSVDFAIADIAATRSGRQLKLGSIRSIMVYMTRPDQVYTLYFDNFRLGNR